MAKAVKAGFVKSLVGRMVSLGVASKANIYPDGGYTVSGKTDAGWLVMQAGVRYVCPHGIGGRSMREARAACAVCKGWAHQ